MFAAGCAAHRHGFGHHSRLPFSSYQAVYFKKTNSEVWNSLSISMLISPCCPYGLFHRFLSFFFFQSWMPQHEKLQAATEENSILFVCEHNLLVPRRIWLNVQAMKLYQENGVDISLVIVTIILWQKLPISLLICIYMSIALQRGKSRHIFLTRYQIDSFCHLVSFWN